MRLAVSGSRGLTALSPGGGVVYRSRDMIRLGLEKMGIEPTRIAEVIHGNCVGCADMAASDWCRHYGVSERVILPDWGKYGWAAGPIRNEEIVAASDVVLAVWDGVSRGTRSTIEHAKMHGVPCYVMRADGSGEWESGSLRQGLREGER